MHGTGGSQIRNQLRGGLNGAAVPGTPVEELPAQQHAGRALRVRWGDQHSGAGRGRSGSEHRDHGETCGGGRATAREVSDHAAEGAAGSNQGGPAHARSSTTTIGLPVERPRTSDAIRGTAGGGGVARAADDPPLVIAHGARSEPRVTGTWRGAPPPDTTVRVTAAPGS